MHIYIKGRVRWVPRHFGSGVLLLNTMKIHCFLTIEKINKEKKKYKGWWTEDGSVIMVGMSIHSCFVLYPGKTFQKWIWIIEWQGKLIKYCDMKLWRVGSMFYSSCYSQGLTLHIAYSRSSVHGYWRRAVWRGWTKQVLETARNLIHNFKAKNLCWNYCAWKTFLLGGIIK